MWGRIAWLASGIVVAGVFAGGPDTARAQCRLCNKPTTALEQTSNGAPLQLSVEATLDFDRLVQLGSGNGTVTLSANGDRSVSGTITAISGRAMVGAISVHGEPNRLVRVELPSQIELYSVGGSGRIEIDDLATDLGSMPKLDGAGNLSFRFGGRLRISGDADGGYRGDVPITVEYM
jgi:hypothetical protein